VGPEAQAAIVELNKGGGLSHEKVVGVLRHLFGIDLSRGAVARIILRAARRVKPTYQAIVKSAAASVWNVADETGWRIGGLTAWLHVFVSARVTCYVIAPSRGFDVIEGVLGAEYAGVLIHDGWAPYDGLKNTRHQQCLAHLLRRCRELCDVAVRGAVRFPRQVKDLLQDALKLRDRHQEGEVSEHGLAVARGRLVSRLDQLLRWTRSNPDNERLAAHLDNHRDDLFTFLVLPWIDATNFRAEQAIRPAVVNRKVWGGNRTQAGAEAQSILMSVLATCRQQGREGLGFISQALRGLQPRLPIMPLGP
jgi:transposase